MNLFHAFNRKLNLEAEPIYDKVATSEYVFDFTTAINNTMNMIQGTLEVVIIIHHIRT